MNGTFYGNSYCCTPAKLCKIDGTLENVYLEWNVLWIFKSNSTY